MKTLFAFLLAGIVSAHALSPLSPFGQTSLDGEADSPHWNTPSAGNPFIPGYFADPTIRKFGDTYFLYATTDGTGNGYGPAQVWVSYDFVNWKNIVMNWPTTEVVWAPDVVQQPDGTYRYYYCEPCNINIGESSSPVGPWHNILGKDDAVMVPDRYVHNVITLDPQLFRDDDGQEYLYFTTWGIYKGFGCGVAKFNSQFSILRSALPLGSSKNSHFKDARRWREDAPFSIAADTFFTEKRLIPNTELKDIFEAPFVFKRNGIYYFTYSSGSCHDHTYRVQYATSSVGPMGPFEYKGCILESNADLTAHGPGHHSILVEDGRYFIVYHRHNLPRSVHGFNRQVCIDEMTFDADGNINPVTPTHSGIQILRSALPLRSSKNSQFSARAPLACYQRDARILNSNKNLAFGAKVTASSYYDEWFKPEYAVDDNNATLWKARHTNWGNGKHQDEWLQIDLGRTQKFSEVWTQFEYATFFYQYKIETSLDGNTWTLYADRTNNTMQGSPMIDRAPVPQTTKRSTTQTTKARYLRITITDTQKNGHMPAIWNVKVWQEAPRLPYSDAQYTAISSQPDTSYPGMHRKDIEGDSRLSNEASMSFDVAAIATARNATQPFDITEAGPFRANKPLRVRVKEGRWAMFFNGTQHLVSEKPLAPDYRYNAPYTVAFWALQTEAGAVSTVASLSRSRADLATTEIRLGSNPQTGLVSHNGSFESYGDAEAVRSCVGQWHHWVFTFDGWMERVYLDGRLLHEQNNFIMVRPEGKVIIGADAAGTNSFKGYLSDLLIVPYALSADSALIALPSTASSAPVGFADGKPFLPSLGDDDFEEIDPDSRFTLPATMKPVYEQQGELRLSASTPDFNADPLNNGGHLFKQVKGDFVVMARLADMEGLQEHSVKAYNEGGLLVCTIHPQTPNDQTTNLPNGQFFQLGVFPLYDCGNMLTVLSPRGRPQYPNYKGYDFDPLLQFERRGTLLYARTSRDGVAWTNMPGSPIDVGSGPLSVGAYQTTYTDTPSWATLSHLIIYENE